MTHALIVTALLDTGSQRRFDELRARHFPPQRNHLAAHLTLFHHLSPADRPALEALLGEAARRLPLAGTTEPPRNLGRGVAIGIDCPELVGLRGWIAERVPGPLTGQDAAWRWPHVTVQNKVEPAAARALHTALAAAHRSQAVSVIGLGLWCYLGGPWAWLAGFAPPVG